MAKPVSSTWRRKPSSVRPHLKPAKLSSLSSVPPVCPRPRPDILAMRTPCVATMGSRQSEVLSPTPPVECLSAFTPLMDERSSVSPLWTIAIVRS